jgi:predicted extracellular nuclease
MDKVTGRLLAGLLLAGMLALTGTAGAQVVVSQVYGGGGNSGATLKSDFIELRNNGPAAVSLDGWSVQYASSSGSSWQVTALQGGIAAGGYYLVKQADGSGGSVELPVPDAIGTIAMSGSNGKVALVAATAALAGTCPLAAAVDFVGYGSANCFEGSGAAPGLSNSTAALRDGDGAVDSDDNAADFDRDAPAPRNSGSDQPPPPDPAIELAIAQIQGDGLLSPYAGERVVTEGVVTALKFNSGFFLQAANDDGNPATSEAVFVYTGSAPPATAAVGNRVRVTGTVDEFIPASNRNQLAITEIVDPEVELLASNAPLPSPVALTAAELSPDAAPATLERLEGMRVSLAEAVVVGPSGGSIDENDARATTDGVFHVTLPQVARPFREPGIGLLDRIEVPAGKDPPRFDTNPERLMVRSWGQVGAEPLSVDVGATVSGLVGVLDYHSATWALTPDPASPPTVSGGMAPVALAPAAADAVTVGGFNLLRLFDEVDDDNGAVTVTPEALERRLSKASGAICDYLRTPDILGVVEVENQRVLGLLAERINSGCASAPGYVALLQPGNDVGGINVGFLVNQQLVGANSRVEVLDVVQFGKDATLANPDGSTSLLNDRPPLLLRARVHHANGAGYPLTVIVNHLRSLNDVDSTEPGSSGWPTAGDRVRAKRGAQAAYLAALVESLQQSDPEANIVLVGDFNAFEFNDGYVDVLGVVRGDEAPADEVLLHVDSPLTTPLLDGSAFIDEPARRYSYSFAGNAQSLDHVLVNGALVAGAGSIAVEHPRINADFGVDNFDDATIAVRSSDHDPVRLTIGVPAFRSADLAVQAGASAARVGHGQPVTFTVQAGNSGPDTAEAVGVAFALDALVSPAVQAPAGWTCAPPAQDGGTTTVGCHRAALGAGDTATFSIDVLAPPAPADGLRLVAAAQSHVTDPANGDNQATVDVAVGAEADLSVQLIGQARRGAMAVFVVPVHNAGPDAAEQPRLVLEGNVDSRHAAVAAPEGWQCTSVRGRGVDFRAECRRDRQAVGTAWFAFAVVDPWHAPGEPLRFSAAVDAGTYDPLPGNNHDSAEAESGRNRGRR